MASEQLRKLMNTNVSNIEQFAYRARYFILKHQFPILLENYQVAFENVVKFANQHCMLRFVPETRHLDDLPTPLLRIIQA